MEDIFLDNKLDIEQIKISLSKLFPDLIIFHWDFNDNCPSDFDSENKMHIFFNTTLNNDKKEFGFVISIYRTPDGDCLERALLIGRKISKDNEVRVLVPFAHPDYPGHPYYDIIFDKGCTYLANDSDTSFADGTDGLVKILEEYKLPELKFDNKARKMNNN